MKRITIIPAVLLLLVTAAAAAQQPSVLIIPERFDFSTPPEQHPQYYIMESRLTTFSQAGEVTGTDTYRLNLEYTPNPDRESGAGVWRCGRLSVSEGDSLTRDVPSLQGWEHSVHPQGYDEKGQVFGIEHSFFENITCSDGTPLPIDKRYNVYNTFLDFHALTSVFPQASAEGNSIQDLHHIGDTTAHYASFTRPPTNLGSSIKEGSYFQNGRIMLELKGVSLAGGELCALVGYDSGESSFKMVLEPFPGMQVTGKGRSRYCGDIYRSLDDNWVKKVDMKETVISGTDIPMTGETIYSVVEREISIRNISREEYESL